MTIHLLKLNNWIFVILKSLQKSLVYPLTPVVFSVQCVLLFPVLLSPAVMELVSMLQDLLTVGAMVVFVDFTLHYSGNILWLMSMFNSLNQAL